MSKPMSGERALFILCGGFLAGALSAAMVVLLARSFHNLPIDLLHLWLPIGLGGGVGLLFGRTQNRLRRVSLGLKESEKNFQQFCQNTPAMLHAMDCHGSLLYVSQAWLDTLGYQRAEVIGQDFFNFVAGTEVTRLRDDHFQQLRETGEIRDRNYQLRRADGSNIAVAISEIAQHDADGQLTRSMAVINDLTKHRAAEERIERLAYYDTLTGLPNRALMYDRILQAMAHAKRDNRQVGIFFFDLDRFKLINDTQGHAVGDLVLRSVAQRLKKFIREGDTFARLGGDEFVVVQADPNHDPNFMTMGQRILEALAQPFQIDKREFFTTASIGVAIYPVDGEDTQTLLKSADTAMYVAKSRGRNNIQFFSEEMNAAALAKTNLESRLRQALSRGELQLHYQPQIDLASGRVTGVEALLRWYDGEGKLIPTSQIIAVAEESSLVLPLGEWALRTACAQAKRWQEAGLPPMRMAVNLSGQHIRQTNFIDQLEAILKEAGIEANTLEIELDENSIMGHVSDNIMALTDLKVHGIRLAIDDFGTGYSSLLYLKHFPINRIKIAKEFIRDIIHNKDYAAVTEAILSMADNLNLAVTAVGVEDPVQLGFLRERGCHEVQGALFGSAMSADKMTAFLKNSEELLRGLKEHGTIKDLHLISSRKIH